MRSLEGSGDLVIMEKNMETTAVCNVSGSRDLVKMEKRMETTLAFMA